MKNRYQTYELILMAYMCILGLLSKRLISPISNILTDFIRIPGGSFSTGFSLLFMIAGVVLIQKAAVGTLIGFTQGVLAFLLGISSFQGPLSIIIYTIPGLMMDGVAYLWKKFNLEQYFDQGFGFVLMGICANISGSLVTNGLFFHLKGILLVLWLALSMLSGGFAGYFVNLFYSKIGKGYRLMQSNQIHHKGEIRYEDK